MKCIQCGSDGCGISICRFSGKPNDEYLRVKRAINAYATAMTERDKAPQWERDMRQGNPDTKPGYL
jgi:hypothetical protein